MSDTPIPDDWTPEDRDDLFAAEFVLGLLDAEERRAAQARADLDGAFQTRIASWERRLEALNAEYTEGPVSDGLYARIEAAIFSSPKDAPTTRRTPAWRLWLAGALTAAAVVIVAAFLWPQPSTTLVARLTAEDLVFDARFEQGILRIAQSGPEAGEGNDFELWAIGEDGVPRSLGILRGDRNEIPAALDAGVTLAVSLEPLGGAPEGAPTGPVLVAAPLTEG
ncbi:MAG: anti-sigma factor domain-containing protein [Pararhodobacter sp.]